MDSEDESELGDYATENLPAEIVNKAERKQSQSVRIVPDQRKSSTGSQVLSSTFSINWYLYITFMDNKKQYVVRNDFQISLCIVLSLGKY